MADILPFVKDKDGRSKSAGASAGEVVIFPGVRIEYHDPAPTPPSGTGRPRRKRSRRTDALTG
jgi:hypothetical protein